MPSVCELSGQEAWGLLCAAQWAQEDPQVGVIGNGQEKESSRTLKVEPSALSMVVIVPL